MAGLEHRLRVRGTARGRQPRWPPHLGTPPPPGPTPTHPPSWPPTLAVYWFLPPLKADSMSGRLRVPRRSAAQWGGWVEVQRGWGRMAGSGSCTIGWVGRGGGWRLRVPQRSAAQWGWGGGWLGSVDRRPRASGSMLSAGRGRGQVGDQDRAPGHQLTLMTPRICPSTAQHHAIRSKGAYSGAHSCPHAHTASCGSVPHLTGRRWGR